MKNNLKSVIEFTGSTYKKELIKVAIISGVIFILGITLFFILKEMIVLISTFILLGGVDFYIISSYSSKKKIILARREEEFITIISYFENFINNRNNVYQSFKAILPYCSVWMQEQIKSLLEQIDNDKSIQPFSTFANKFTTPIVSNVMLSIYQMVDQGESREQMLQFTILFETMSKAHHREMIDKKERSFENVGVFPLVGAGALTIILTVSILSILGDLINVF